MVHVFLWSYLNHPFWSNNGYSSSLFDMHLPYFERISISFHLYLRLYGHHTLHYWSSVRGSWYLLRYGPPLYIFINEDHTPLNNQILHILHIPWIYFDLRSVLLLKFHGEWTHYNLKFESKLWNGVKHHKEQPTCYSHTVCCLIVVEGTPMLFFPHTHTIICNLTLPFCIGYKPNAGIGLYILLLDSPRLLKLSPNTSFLVYNLFKSG